MSIGEREQIDFYDLFLMKAEPLCSGAAVTVQELADLLAVNKTQLNAWLKQAVADGKMQKLSRPLRYEWGQAGFIDVRDDAFIKIPTSLAFLSVLFAATLVT